MYKECQKRNKTTEIQMLELVITLENSMTEALVSAKVHGLYKLSLSKGLRGPHNEVAF